ncbi:MAG: hypothetical protein QME46_11835 [Thermoanaerobacteraceae bacterium]|nr:hypothetical protein [Thermoanaerobacteraceae bacterium]
MIELEKARSHLEELGLKSTATFLDAFLRETKIKTHLLNLIK